MLKLYSETIELCQTLSQVQMCLVFDERKEVFKYYVDALTGRLQFAEAVRVINLNLKNIKNAKMLEMLMFCYDRLRFCFHGIKDSKRAIKFCRKANFLGFFKLCPGRLPEDAFAECYKCIGKLTKAMNSFDRILQRCESQEDISFSAIFHLSRYSKGSCLLELGRFQEAKNWFENSIDLRRASVPQRTRDSFLCTCEILLSQCLSGLGEYDEALKRLESIDDTDLCQSFFGEEWKHKVLYVKAECLFGLQKFAEAYDCHKTCLWFFSSEIFKKKEMIASLHGLVQCSENLQKYHETLHWEEMLLKALETLTKDRKEIAERTVRIFRLHIRLRFDEDQPSPLVYDDTFSEIVKERNDDTLKCLYFFEKAKGSLPQQDIRTASALYRSAFEHLKQLPNDKALPLAQYFQNATDRMVLCCLNSKMYTDGLQYCRQVWSLVKEFSCTTDETEEKCLVIRNISICLHRTSRYSECFQALQYGLPMAQKLNDNAHLHKEFLVMVSIYCELHYARREQDKLHFCCYTHSIYCGTILQAKNVYESKILERRKHLKEEQ